MRSHHGGHCGDFRALGDCAKFALHPLPVWQAIPNFTFNMRHWKLFLLSLQVAVNVFIVSMLLVVTGQYGHIASEDLGYNYKNLYYIDVRTTKVNTPTLIFECVKVDA